MGLMKVLRAMKATMATPKTTATMQGLSRSIKQGAAALIADLLEDKHAFRLVRGRRHGLLQSARAEREDREAGPHNKQSWSTIRARLISKKPIKALVRLTNVRSREVMRSILRSTAAGVVARMSMVDDGGSIESCKVPVWGSETSRWL